MENNFYNIHGFLSTLQPIVLQKLFNDGLTCLAIFRELPELCKHIVLRLLFIDQPISKPSVLSWFTPKESVDILKPLITLQIFHQSSVEEIESVRMNSLFAKNFRTAMFGSDKLASVTEEDPSEEKHSKDEAFLEDYSTKRWQCLLHFLAQSTEETEPISRETLSVVLYANLMKEANNDTSITPAGFRFLLMSRQNQIWHYLIHYLRYAHSKGTDLAELLTFVFQLSFACPSKSYPTESLSAVQLTFLQHLRELGLVYQRKRTAGRYYPTQMAVSLSSGLASDDDEQTSKDGFIIVETNYRVYAYTDSSLDVALVALFCEMLYRFPNLSVGVISRDSVREAMARGITAEQIVRFLRTNAHAHSVDDDEPSIPPAIVDQIRLWELERDRFTFTDGVLYNQFLSQADFELLRDYARDLAVLEWENVDSRTMVVSKAGHEDVKRFWKRQKKS